MSTLLRTLVFCVVFIATWSGTAAAQQISGVPGSPSATTTIPGNQLPAPPTKFGGVIKPLAQDSKPYWPARVVPPKGAPNVLLIVTDDSGFGVPSTFGGVIPTPALDRVAANGLRYTNFHSTALCSPTRAALITGRNHHSVGFGVIAEQSTGFPGYDSLIAPDKATVGRILRDHGFRTSWFGKNHNTPGFVSSQNGPFDLWPIGMGFEYFYGFIGGDTSQWQPNLFRNTTQIYPFEGKAPGTWNLTTAMADDAIEYLNRMNALDPEQPFFLYYAPGGTHAPHHPTKEWIDKISAMKLFDKGWNQLRETIFENQKKLGVIPANTKLTPWPKDLLKEWDQLSADEKKMFTRQAEVFAAYVAYTDHQIGRVIQAVQDQGKLDNTLIIYINGDNGTSSEGTLLGTPNETAMFNGVDVPVDVQLKFYDAWGSDQTYPHMAVPWAWAFDTPFKWTKQIVSHLGGVRQGMAISWPNVIQDKGGMRHQFHHVIDVVPTILEATKIKQPKAVDGIQQSPIEGVSMAYTFDAKNAKARTTHPTQYFEMMGDHAIYHDGWWAGTKVMRPPWVTAGGVGADPLSYPWELYNLNEDWSQSDDLAAKYPDKVKQMKALFMQEAKKYQVLPIDATVITRVITPRPSIVAGRNVFTWTQPLVGTPMGTAPSVLNTSYNFKADVEVPAVGAEGMLITQGGRFGGYGMYLKQSKPVFVWNMLGLQKIEWRGADALAPGRHVVEFDFKYDGMGMGTLAFNSFAGVGQGGTGVLKVDGSVVATQKMEHTIPFLMPIDESLDIGADTLTGVNDADYQPPFAFGGKLNKVTLTLDRPTISPADAQKLKAAQAAAARAKE
jgi:arylsulfatase A-like enzyme